MRRFGREEIVPMLEDEDFRCELSLIPKRLDLRVSEPSGIFFSAIQSFFLCCEAELM